MIACLVDLFLGCWLLRLVLVSRLVCVVVTGLGVCVLRVCCWLYCIAWIVGFGNLVSMDYC